MNTSSRINIVFNLLVLIVAVFVVRLFDLQIIGRRKYEDEARGEQFEELQIPAQRGLIYVQQGGSIVPIVLNQKLYTLFGDPAITNNPQAVAAKIASVIGGSASNYQKQLTNKTSQYVVLANQLTEAQSNKILGYNLVGIGTKGQDYRVYPDGSLAAQTLGFVNNTGQGEYGIEQALNKELSGTPGELKAYTDVNGVPLVAAPGNVDVQPVPGKNVVLTVHTTMQTEVQQILQQGLQKAHSNSGSAIIMNLTNGHVDTIADYPTYNPTDYSQVANPSEFINSAVGTPLEVGSIMKTLTTSAALDTNSITPNETFFDPAKWLIDGSWITDISQDGGPQQRSITDILVDSLNTGATWMLMQMGGGQINSKARDTWNNYMVNHFHLGSQTGIQQGYEASGYVPQPGHDGAGIDLTYANTAFGQATTETPLQMVAALSSVLNGGTYYNPSLVLGTVSANGNLIPAQPTIWKKNVVKPTVATELEPMMEAVINKNYWFYQMQQTPKGYIIGGKTGTAQIANPSGGYYSNQFNGTFIGFVGGAKPKYAIMTEVNSPNIPNNSIDTYAGAGAAAPIWGGIVKMLIDTGHVTPVG